jgi:hypothetical protein
MSLFHAAIAAMLLAVSASAVQATTITFQQGVGGYTGQLDVQVRNDAANLNQSSNSSTNVTGWTGGATPVTLRTLQTWDLSLIPVGATITSATLTMGNRSDTGASVDDTNTAIDALDPLVDLRTISAPITEPPVISTSTTAGSNWNNTFGGGVTLGGSVLSSARFDPEVLTLINYNTFASSPAFVAAVQAAVDGSNLLNLALLLANESGSSRVAIQFSANIGNLNGSNPTVPDRPLLTIEYTEVPEPASLGLVGLCAVVMVGCRRSRV